MDTSLLFVPLTLLAGGLLAVQAGANAQLSRATGSPLAASAVQLAVGLGLLTTAAAAAGALGALAPLPHVAWWQWFGGLASALYVTSASLANTPSQEECVTRRSVLARPWRRCYR